MNATFDLLVCGTSVNVDVVSGGNKVHVIFGESSEGRIAIEIWWDNNIRQSDWSLSRGECCADFFKDLSQSCRSGCSGFFKSLLCGGGRRGSELECTVGSGGNGPGCNF